MVEEHWVVKAWLSVQAPTWQAQWDDLYAFILSLYLPFQAFLNTDIREPTLALIKAVS